MFKKLRLVWSDKFALSLASVIAFVALLVWVCGIVGLAGHPHFRFDAAMTKWTLEAEFMLVAPTWLFLRAMDLGARALKLLLRFGLARVRSGEWRLPSYPSAGSAHSLQPEV